MRAKGGTLWLILSLEESVARLQSIGGGHVIGVVLGCTPEKWLSCWPLPSFGSRSEWPR